VVLDLTGVSALVTLGPDQRASARTSARSSFARVAQAAKSLRR
jgi:hypothetical protein